VSLLTPEQYRVTQEDGTERPLQNQMTEETIPRVAVLNAGFVGEARCP
jgi:peptide methionine sulfoxide reductase MsrB